jgi:excisionase family DNA binding protein
VLSTIKVDVALTACGALLHGMRTNASRSRDLNALNRSVSDGRLSETGESRLPKAKGSPPEPLARPDGFVQAHTSDERPRAGLVTIDIVAERLGVQVRHVRRLVGDRRIPFIKWGHLLRFDPVEIEAWLDDARRSPEAS